MQAPVPSAVAAPGCDVQRPSEACESYSTPGRRPGRHPLSTRVRPEETRIPHGGRQRRRPTDGPDEARDVLVAHRQSRDFRHQEQAQRDAGRPTNPGWRCDRNHVERRAQLPALPLSAAGTMGSGQTRVHARGERSRRRRFSPWTGRRAASPEGRARAGRRPGSPALRRRPAPRPDLRARAPLRPRS